MGLSSLLKNKQFLLKFLTINIKFSKNSIKSIFKNLLKRNTPQKIQKKSQLIK